MLVRQPRPTRKRALKSRRSPPALPPGRSSPCPGPSPPPCRQRPCPPTLEAWLKAVHTHAIHSLDASIWWFSIFRGSCGHHHDPVRTFPPKRSPTSSPAAPRSLPPPSLGTKACMQTPLSACLTQTKSHHRGPGVLLPPQHRVHKGAAWSRRQHLMPLCGRGTFLHTAHTFTHLWTSVTSTLVS